MLSGGREPGAGRQARQVQMPGNFIGNQSSMRGIQQGMKQLQVSSQGTILEQSNDRPQQSNTPWSVTNVSQDKRSARHAEALREIRHSLQSYEVGGDVDSSLLSRCVELGFDEEISRHVLRANKDKDFGVVLATLMSLTNFSGRKAIKTVAPGTLQSVRGTPPISNANIPRTHQLPQSQKVYGSQPNLVWNPASQVPASGNNVYIKSAAIPTSRLDNRGAFRRQTGELAMKGQVNTATDPFRVERGQFNIGERKVQETIMSKYPEVRFRQNRSQNRDSQKRWSADVLQKTKAFELPNKRSSLAFEVGDRKSPFDIPNKPPPPYPGFQQNQLQADPRFDQWMGGAKAAPPTGNMKRIASMETVAKVGTESPRLSSPVTIVSDNRKQSLNGSDKSIQGLHAIDRSAFQSVTVNNPYVQRDPPPPYHTGPHRPLQRTYSPNDRGNLSTRINPSASVNQQVYTTFPTNDNHLFPGDSLQDAFIPIRPDALNENPYKVNQEEVVVPRLSPPPYPGLEHRQTAKEKRFSYASDVDSGTSSKRASAIFADGSTQSDSSGSTSPTPETIESRCSPLPLTSSPYHTLVIHSSDSEVKTETEKVKEEPFNSRLKGCSSHAYKFFMEQHVENVLKFQQLREKRKKQLEIEMSKCGLSEESQTEMRKMLVQKESNHIRMKRSKMTRSMFSKVKTLGMGAFGEVALVRKIDSNALYAMKTLRKADVIRRNQVAHVKAERDILAEADNEWVVKLYYSFQDTDNLYFVMEYVPGGDLMALLIKRGIFSEELGQFYTAELVLAVESVHKLGFIHRDIKPDNVLIDRNGHIKLTDFGLCTGFRWTHDSKYYQQDPNHARQPSMEPEGGWENLLNDAHCDCGDVIKKFDLCKPLDRRAARQHMRCLAHSLVGTPNYIAPEVLLRVPYTQLCDWWSVGVILYEMLVGQPPFLARSPAETQMKVVHWQNTLKIPPHARLSREAEDLIQRLCAGPEIRLGRMGTDEIKKHPFFMGVDWINCLKNKPPPYIPNIKHATDTSNFDPVPEKEAENEIDEAREQEKKLILDKGPQHAFYEFTFRRFFDEGGHPQAFWLEDESHNDWQGQQSDPICQGNKRTVTTSDKSVPIPNKVAAPPINQAKLEDKAPIYVIGVNLDWLTKESPSKDPSQ